MKKFKDFIKKKPEYKPAFFGFIRKPTPEKKDAKKLKEAHDYDDHFDDEHEDHEEHDEHHDVDYDAPHHDSLSKHYHEKDPTYKNGGSGYKHYDVHDMDHIREYTTDSSETNQAMVQNHDYTSHHVEGLKKALTKVKTPHDIEVHTGTAFSPERYKDHNHSPHENIKVHLPAFTSTSLKSSIANGFAKHDPQHPHVYLHEGMFGNPAPLKKLDGEDLPKEREEDFHSLYVKRIKEKYGDNKVPYKYNHVISLKVPKGSHGAYVGHKEFSEHKDEREFILHPGAKAHIHPEPTIDHHRKVLKWHGVVVHDGVNKEEDDKQMKFPFMK